MKFKMHIDSDNDAFVDNGTSEVIRIMRVIVTRIEDGRTDGACMDVNGNKVGSWELDLDSED